MFNQKTFIHLWYVLIFFGISYSQVNATHIRGGEITYTQKQGLEFCFIIRLYSDNAPGNADSPDLDIDFGDGTAPMNVPRTNFIELGPSEQVNIYEVCHTFPANGSYEVSFVEENRNDGIININNGNSVNIPFATKTLIQIGPDVGTNNSPVFLENPIFFTHANEVFQQNILAFDAQGDSLAYKLTNPLQSKDENALYFLPEGFRVNQISGEVIWDKPQISGEYVFAVQIQKWRDGVMIGMIQRDIQIIVVDLGTSPNPPEISPQFTALDLDNPDGISIETNERLSFCVIILKDVDPDLESEFNAYSELLERGMAQMQTRDSTNTEGQAYSIIQIDWTPGVGEVRANPYVITFRRKYKGFSFFQKDLTLVLYVGADVIPSADVIVSVPDPEDTQKKVQPYPNPFQNKLHLKFKQDLINSSKKIYFKDTYGKIVRAYEIDPGEKQELDVSTLPIGQYILEVYQKGQLVYRERAIKK